MATDHGDEQTGHRQRVRRGPQPTTTRGVETRQREFDEAKKLADEAGEGARGKQLRARLERARKALQRQVEIQEKRKRRGEPLRQGPARRRR